MVKEIILSHQYFLLTWWPLSVLITDLSYEIRGPRHRRSCLPSLAARPRADRVQGRRSNVQSFTWKCAGVSGTIVAVADLPGRRTLRSGGTNHLMVPSARRSTVGDRAFTVAGPRV